ncbi:HNH endonuclease [Quillaja saponaria]|uniref:HNH endonuclease n=1 Tax=Quillaja saponaria TaxID=32244 RepID=A0AAD7QBH3_QUISA|nr:HNH endonuclease [Quillaja saponaria]
MRQQCWEKAEKIKGRDPERWRRDPLGNIVFGKLVGCPGCLCHDYDHIVPYSSLQGRKKHIRKLSGFTGYS